MTHRLCCSEYERFYSSHFGSRQTRMLWVVQSSHLLQVYSHLQFLFVVLLLDYMKSRFSFFDVCDFRLSSCPMSWVSSFPNVPHFLSGVSTRKNDGALHSLMLCTPPVLHSLWSFVLELRALEFAFLLRRQFCFSLKLSGAWETCLVSCSQGLFCQWPE